MSSNKLTTILLIVFAIAMVVMIGVFTKDLIFEDTKVKIASYEESKEALEEEINNDITYATYRPLEDIEEEIIVSESNLADVKKNAVIDYSKRLENETKKLEVKDEISVETQPQPSNYYKGYETIGKIEIPKIGLNYPILKYQSVAGMEIAPCLVYFKGTFNESGFAYITGHNYKNGLLFSNLNNVNVGDSISITSVNGTQKTYTITQKYVTSPEDVSYLKQDDDGKTKIILQTCTDNELNRIIIIAKR